MRDAPPQGTYKVQALDRAFAVLDLLGESETPLGLAQVAASLQLHKSTAHRFLMVLERHRMVERTANGKFRLGLRLFDFGNRAIEQYDLRDRAQPHLRRLVAETEETAHLALLEAARVIYIDKIEPTRSVRMITRIGASNPVHCTSVGKAILAFLPPERSAEIVRRIRFERMHEPHHHHARSPARRARKDAPPRLRGRRRGAGGRPALHRRSGAGRAAAAGGGGERLRAVVPRDRAEAALHRQPSAAVRARHFDGHGIHAFGPRRTGPLPAPEPGHIWPRFPLRRSSRVPEGRAFLVHSCMLPPRKRAAILSALSSHHELILGT